MGALRRTGGSSARSSRRARDLLDWFAQHRRPLPWRSSRDPYRIWVAETLLQQTRVAQAVPYFERFIVRFPTVQVLARAKEATVLKTWEGAGYYDRARRLRSAAKVVVKRYRGALPSTVAELERLPGIGPYTARAIAALAFDRPCVALEANGLRVAARWTNERGDIRRSEVRRKLARHLEQSLPPDRAAEFNEAVMELGETVCLPHRPRCSGCPVARRCRAFRELGDPSVVPRHRVRAARPHVKASVVVLERAGRWLVQRRPEGGLLGGLWEFPGGKIEMGETPEVAARREMREEVGSVPVALETVGVVRHGYSHFTVELHVFRAGVSRKIRLASSQRWATPREIARLPLPRATQKVLLQLGAPSAASR